MIGRLFGIDPVIVLAERDEVRRAVRVAAALHVIAEENRQNQAQRQQQRRR